MPLLADYCTKNSSRSKGENGAEDHCCSDQNKSESDLAISCTPECSDGRKPKCKYAGVNIAKTLLGPSLEDAVLKTLEFGKSLMQNSNELACSGKPAPKPTKKTCKDRCKSRTEKCIEHGPKNRFCGAKNHSDRQGKKRILYSARLDENLPLIRKPPRKISQLSKIRSLDSDLKTSPHSPEKIKKQLEALIQINKEDPSEPPCNWNILSKVPAVPVEMTIMPSVCIYKNDVDFNSSSCDAQSLGRSSCDQSSSNRCERRNRNRLRAASGICQAPEFISNALGPTLDVSIIDNLKMMRNIFKSENGKGEGVTVCTGGSKRSSCVSFVDSGSSKQGFCHRRSSPLPPCAKASMSQESAACKIKEAEKTIQDLQQKICNLQKLIEHEERERACKRKLFEEEEKRMCEMKAFLQNKVAQARGGATRECSTQRSQPDLNYDSKLESLRQRIACDEEKLSRLRDQYECYRRELCVARSRCEAVKRNKCILDAWDIIASRACHTRLPSFSRAYALERKELKVNGDAANTHCCFPSTASATEASKTTRSSCSQTKSHCGRVCASRSKESVACEYASGAKACLMAQGEIPFPIQRDVTCGLHQNLRTCCCSKFKGKGDAPTCSSDDDLMKKSGSAKRSCKAPCRSKSDTSVRADKNSKIVKVLWAITRINIFQDNCRTYEVMEATTTPPPCIPSKTEGIFVVRNAQKKGCPVSQQKKKCVINFSTK